MEYAKDEIYSVYYNKGKDKLEKSFLKRFWNKIINNKFLTLLISLGVIFSILNFILIYSFFEILNKI